MLLRCVLRIGLVALLALVVPGLAHAQTTGDWQPSDFTDPVKNICVTADGMVYVKAAAPNPYANSELTIGALSRSADRGATWTGVPLPPDLAVAAIDLSNGTTMFGGSTEGHSRSLDGGLTWTLVFPSTSSAAASAATVPRVQISPSDSNLVYAARGNTL